MYCRSNDTFVLPRFINPLAGKKYHHGRRAECTAFRFEIPDRSIGSTNRTCARGRRVGTPAPNRKCGVLRYHRSILCRPSVNDDAFLDRRNLGWYCDRTAGVRLNKGKSSPSSPKWNIGSVRSTGVVSVASWTDNSFRLSGVDCAPNHWLYR